MHAQLLTPNKVFCACSTRFDDRRTYTLARDGPFLRGRSARAGAVLYCVAYGRVGNLSPRVLSAARITAMDTQKS